MRLRLTLMRSLVVLVREAREARQRDPIEAPSSGAEAAVARAEVPEPQSYQRAREAAALMAILPRVATVMAAAPRRMSGAAGAAHWAPCCLGDGEGWVCLAWAYPRTCRVGGTLPTLGGPEKPCDVDWSNHAAQRLDCPYRI